MNPLEQHPPRRRPQPRSALPALTAGLVIAISSALGLALASPTIAWVIKLLLGLLVVVALLLAYTTRQDSARRSSASSQRRNQDQLDQKLLAATHQINQSLDLDRVLDSVLRQARQLLDARDGSLMLVHGTQELRVAAVIGDSAAQGARRAFGPRDAVLKEVMQNANDLKRNAGPGGVS